MALTPEEQRELEELELEQLEAEERAVSAPKPAAAPRMQEPDTPVSSPEATTRGLADVLTFGTAKYTAPALRGGLNYVLPKGASEYLNLQPYDVEKAKYQEREEIAKQYEPGSYMGGQGFGLGLQLLGAPFAGAAQGARALAQRAFMTPAGQAGVGAVQAGAESSFDPLEVLKGAGTAGTLTKLGGMGATAIQPKLEQAAYERAAKATGADILKPSRQIERMPGGRQAYGKDVLKQGIVTAGKTVPEIAEEATKQEDKYGKAIGKIYQRLDAIEGGEVPQDFMGKLIQKLYADVIAPLRKTAAKSAMADRIEQAYVGKLAQMVEDGYKPSFSQLHDEMRGLGELAYTPTGIDKPMNEQLQKVQRIMRGAMQKQAGQTEAGADLLDALKAANRKYSVATQAAQTAKEKTTRMASNRQISLSDYIAGSGGLAGGAAIGGGVGGAIGAAGLALLNKVARERGPQVAASMLNAAQQMAKNDPNKVGVYLNFLAGEQATKALGGNKE